jgi:probable phosphoglycerate mutase
VLIVRHAPSTWNAEGRWQGRADPPLSPAGEDMAAAAAARVGAVDLVVTSDLARAVDTGRLLAPDAPAVVDAGLGEHDVGAWSGLTREEIGRRWPAELAAFDAGRLQVPPGGESRLDFEVRVTAAIDRIVIEIAGSGAERALVVTHAGVVRAMCRLRGGFDRHVGHLCGFDAVVKGGTLAMGQPLCLLDSVGPTEERDESQAL